MPERVLRYAWDTFNAFPVGEEQIIPMACLKGLVVFWGLGGPYCILYWFGLIKISESALACRVPGYRSFALSWNVSFESLEGI